MTVRWPSLIVGIICIVVGLVWVLQGAGFIAGSVMTRQTVWLVIGAILVVVGLVLGFRAVSGRPRLV